MVQEQQVLAVALVDQAVALVEPGVLAVLLLLLVKVMLVVQVLMVEVAVAVVLVPLENFHQEVMVALEALVQHLLLQVHL